MQNYLSSTLCPGKVVTDAQQIKKKKKCNIWNQKTVEGGSLFANLCPQAAKQENNLNKKNIN